MKRWLMGYVAVLVLVAAADASAQEWAKKMFETTSHDFGSVARGAKVEYRFVLTNIYEEDVHVAGVRSSCGCTSPTISKDQLKTYEKGAIVAAFNTQHFLGQRSATITVTIDKPFYAEVQLNVQGYIRSDIVFTPGLADMGNVDLGAPAEKKVTITYAGRDDWKITDVKPSSKHLEATIKEQTRAVGQVTYELTVKLLPGSPLGYVHDQVTLITNDQRSTQVPLDVEARIVSEVTLNPASLFLGVLKPGQKVTKQLVVQGKKPFRITGVKCAAQGYQFQPDNEAKAVHLLPVTYTAGDKPGKFIDKIVIESDLGAGVIPELSTYAQVVAPEPAKSSEPAKPATPPASTAASPLTTTGQTAGAGS